MSLVTLNFERFEDKMRKKIRKVKTTVECGRNTWFPCFPRQVSERWYVNQTSRARIDYAGDANGCRETTAKITLEAEYIAMEYSFFMSSLLTLQLWHELSRHKENEICGDSTACLVKQSKNGGVGALMTVCVFIRARRVTLQNIASNARTMRRRLSTTM